MNVGSDAVNSSVAGSYNNLDSSYQGIQNQIAQQQQQLRDELASIADSCKCGCGGKCKNKWAIGLGAVLIAGSVYIAYR